MERTSCSSSRLAAPLQLVLSRELNSSTRVITRLNWKILRSIITSRDGPKPQDVGIFNSTKSSGRIIYTDGHLLINDTENIKELQVYCLNGTGNGYFCKKKYRLPSVWKDRDFGIGPTPSQAKYSQSGFKTVLYFITARSLHSMDMNSGDLMETVSLPEGYKFSGLSIDDETHLLAVSSQKNCSASKEDVLLAFALFECYPQLSFQELLQIKKSVFGNTILGAEINQGILLTLHRSNRIRAYSLVSVLQNKNYAPPVLLNVTSFNHIMNIGASPYHLLEASSYNSFQVFNMDTGHLLDGTLEGDEDSFDLGVCFHPDGSPRLIFSENGTIRLYNISANAKEGSVASLVLGSFHSVHSIADKQSSDVSATMITSSGRTVRRPSYATACVLSDPNDPTTLLAWDYESDLDLLGVVYSRSVYYRMQNHMELLLDLIDSRSGVLLRRIQLSDSFRALSESAADIYLKLDADLCLVSVPRNQRVSILVYRFNHTEEGSN